MLRRVDERAGFAMRGRRRSASSGSSERGCEQHGSALMVVDADEVAEPPHGRFGMMSLEEEEWVANAIEPVVSPRGSFSTAGSSVSDGGDAAAAAARYSRMGRFRGIRVYIRRRAQQQRHHQLHRHSLAPPSHQHHQHPRLQQLHLQRRSSVVSRSSTMTSTRRSTWRHSLAPTGVPSAHWTETSNSVDVSDLERSSDNSQAEPTSRRSKAWQRISGVRLRMKRLKKAKTMYSISFYPWKMEAHGYYSNPESAAEWVPDTASARCQICLASFNLTRRRHHCRLCGYLVCNDCSLQRTFLPFSDEPRRRTNHSLIKNGEAQRTCNSCAKTLKLMAAQSDHRVKQFSVDVSASICDDESSRSSSVSGRSSKDSSRDSNQSGYDHFSPEQQLQIVRPRAISKATAARNEELEMVLLARAQSRANAVTTQQHVINSQWLEQWLHYVQADAGEPVAPLGRHASRRSMGPRRRGHHHQHHGRRPGPITNYALLDFESGKLVQREGLHRSRGSDGVGDFHIISRDVWLVFLRLYGGGPSIRVDGDGTAHAMFNGESSRVLVITGTEGDANTPGATSTRWIITELDDTISGLQTPAEGSQSPGKEPGASDKFECGQQLALRSASACVFPREGDRSHSRPASTSAISSPPPPPVLAVKQRQLQPTEQRSRRVSSSFVGYWKKWRQSDDSSNSNISNNTNGSTISPVAEGVVLYDPVHQSEKMRSSSLRSVEEREVECEEHCGRGFASDKGNGKQRDTMAAVSAFAVAAAEARRKSTMSLLRHTTLSTRSSGHSSVMSA